MKKVRNLETLFLLSIKIKHVSSFYSFLGAVRKEQKKLIVSFLFFQGKANCNFFLLLLILIKYFILFKKECLQQQKEKNRGKKRKREIFSFLFKWFRLNDRSIDIWMCLLIFPLSFFPFLAYLYLYIYMYFLDAITNWNSLLLAVKKLNFTSLFQ